MKLLATESNDDAIESAKQVDLLISMILYPKNSTTPRDLQPLVNTFASGIALTAPNFDLLNKFAGQIGGIPPHNQLDYDPRSNDQRRVARQKLRDNIMNASPDALRSRLATVRRQVDEWAEKHELEPEPVLPAPAPRMPLSAAAMRDGAESLSAQRELQMLRRELSLAKSRLETVQQKLRLAQEAERAALNRSDELAGERYKIGEKLKEMTEIARAHEERGDETESRLAEVMAQSDSRYADLVMENDRLKQIIANLHEEIKVVSLRMADYEKLKAEAAKHHERIAAFTQQVEATARLEDRIRDLENELSHTVQALDLLRREWTVATEGLEEANKRIAEMEAEKEQMDTAFNVMATEMDDLLAQVEEIKDLREALDDATADAAFQRSRVEHLYAVIHGSPPPDPAPDPEPPPEQEDDDEDDEQGDDEEEEAEPETSRPFEEPGLFEVHEPSATVWVHIRRVFEVVRAVEEGVTVNDVKQKLLGSPPLNNSHIQKACRYLYLWGIAERTLFMPGKSFHYRAWPPFRHGNHTIEEARRNAVDPNYVIGALHATMDRFGTQPFEFDDLPGERNLVYRVLQRYIESGIVEEVTLGSGGRQWTAYRQKPRPKEEKSAN